MKHIIERIKSQIRSNETAIFDAYKNHSYYFTDEEAQQIVEALEGMESGRSFILPKGEEVNGMLNIALRYLSNEQANVLIEGLIKRFLLSDDVKTKILNNI